MNREEKISYWMDIAAYDLETARAMVTSGRFLYAAFMSQQALEKALKAAHLAVLDQGEPPRTHNLGYLLDSLERTDAPTAIGQLAARLSAYYIEARYPNYKEKLSQLVGAEEARDLVSRTEEAVEWVLSLID